jgi:hypothetical protein
MTATTILTGTLPNKQFPAGVVELGKCFHNFNLPVIRLAKVNVMQRYIAHRTYFRAGKPEQFAACFSRRILKRRRRFYVCETASPSTTRYKPATASIHKQSN